MFTTFLVQPIYNLFVFLLGLMPQGDAGLAIVALTLFMRAVLYPIFTASIRTQMGMQAMQPELDAALEKYKDDKEALTRERMALLKKHKVNPFAGFGALIVQLVVLVALYFALFREGFPAIHTELLYSFVSVPAQVSTAFFGLMDLLAPKNIVLALLVGATQYLAIRLTLRRTPAPTHPDKEAAHRLQSQMMLYFMPALMAGVSYFFPAAVGIYFVTGNLVSLFQEWMLMRGKKQN
ncbi:MAG: 60 kDa inner rane insertion protein preprotein translocase subunit YidC [Candidatus Adlerbacteria bacterium]|nr:60 kDa inner rane insertion protein preprotein translocase subunit YidC [Candidatus Adlerbacteria bacterium]